MEFEITWVHEFLTCNILFVVLDLGYGAHVYDPFCCRLLIIALCEMKVEKS